MLFYAARCSSYPLSFSTAIVKGNRNVENGNPENILKQDEY